MIPMEGWKMKSQRLAATRAPRRTAHQERAVAWAPRIPMSAIAAKSRATP